MRRLAVLPFLLLATLLPCFAPAAAASAAYVIITGDALVPEFQRLADWRTGHGLPAEVVTVAWIEAHYPGGVDAAERVRRFIQDAYASQGTLWVLLGGDAEVLPALYAHMNILDGSNILTDYYYMCLDGTWNADGDAFFGEVEDEVDLLPEVFAGRAPVSTLEEARTFADKTLAYEEGAGGGEGYPASALFLAERLFPTFGGAQIAEAAIAALPPSFTVERLYEEGGWPGSHALNRAAAIEAIERGFGLVYHIGHSTETTWSLVDDVLTTEDVDHLTNGPRTSVVFAFGGRTAAFDFDDAIAERWLVNPEGGSVAYVGSTALSFIGATRDLQAEWFRLVFQESMRALGAATALARMPFVASAQVEGSARWMLFAFELLGDPALALRVREEPAAVSGPASSPGAVALLEAVPNPFRSRAQIAFDAPPAGDAARVELAVFDAAGRLVRTLVDGPVAPGRHTIAWDGRTARSEAPAGVYFLRLAAGGSTRVEKLAIAR